MTIWKYVLVIDDVQYIEMPMGAKLLDVQMQNGNPCLWVLVNPNAERESRAIYMRGTGHNANHVKDLTYVATFQMHNGELIFHVFV